MGAGDPTLPLPGAPTDGARISGRTPTSNVLLPYRMMVMQRVHRDTRFILVPTSRPYVQQYASRAMYLAPKDACRGGLQAGWERERGSQVPMRTGVIEASANTV